MMLKLDQNMFVCVVFVYFLKIRYFYVVKMYMKICCLKFVLYINIVINVIKSVMLEIVQILKVVGKIFGFVIYVIENY